MSYVDRINTHWKKTYDIAKEGGASELQLRALTDLAESEFGYRSGNRLRNLWRTSIDIDGDVVLTFEELSLLKQVAAVAVNLDQDGVLTTKNLLTGEVDVYDPFADCGKDDEFAVWVIPDSFIAPFCEPSLKFTVIGNENPPLIAVETERIGGALMPVYSPPRFKVLTNTGYWDGPLSGFARLDGDLMYFNCLHEDDVSGERIYSVFYVSGLKALNFHVMNQMWKFRRRFGWGPRGFSAAALTNFDDEDNHIGYAVLKQVTTVTH